MTVTLDRHGHVLRISAVLICLFLGACRNSSAGSARTGSEPDPTVTVLTGIDQAPADMQGATRAVARYFADSDKVVYISDFQYRATCPPEAKATQNGGTITLTVEDPGGNCTADARRDTFEIEHVTSDASRLVIAEAGQPDIRLDLSA
jgi:hypothetical protein